MSSRPTVYCLLATSRQRREKETGRQKDFILYTKVVITWMRLGELMKVCRVKMFPQGTWDLLGCNAVQWCGGTPTFRGAFLPPSSTQQTANWTFITLKTSSLALIKSESSLSLTQPHPLPLHLSLSHANPVQALTAYFYMIVCNCKLPFPFCFPRYLVRLSLCLSNHHAKKTYGEWRYSSTHS
jgi:hypothetical protein